MMVFMVTAMMNVESNGSRCWWRWVALRGEELMFGVNCVICVWYGTYREQDKHLSEKMALVTEIFSKLIIL